MPTHILSINISNTYSLNKHFQHIFSQTSLIKNIFTQKSISNTSSLNEHQQQSTLLLLKIIQTHLLSMSINNTYSLKTYTNTSSLNEHQQHFFSKNLYQHIFSQTLNEHQQHFFSKNLYPHIFSQWASTSHVLPKSINKIHKKLDEFWGMDWKAMRKSLISTVEKLDKYCRKAW